MKRTYVLEWVDGTPVIWRLHDVLPSVRLFEDGFVAFEHKRLAERLMGRDVVMKRYSDYSDAAADIKIALVNVEPVWLHHFSLAVGYNDRYP